MYTVMAAAMKRKVVAVDPIIKNLALINKSLKESQLLSYVSLINNPIRSYNTLTSMKNGSISNICYFLPIFINRN